MTDRTDRDKYVKLDYAERWMRDGLSVVDAPGFFQSLEVDMSQGKAVIGKLRQAGVQVTYTHLFVRAVALVLARRPELHQLVSGRSKLLPGTVDIGLSISGSMFVAPVLVIRDAARKTLVEIAAEVAEKAPGIREQQEKFLETIRKWGWLVPFGWLRRWYLRVLTRQLWFRRQGVGTFQVSCLPDVDQFVPLLFSTSAILGAGRVCDRVVASDGQPRVTPTVILSCCADHKVWDGVKAATFLVELREVLVSQDLESIVTG